VSLLKEFAFQLARQKKENELKGRNYLNKKNIYFLKYILKTRFCFSEHIFSSFIPVL